MRPVALQPLFGIPDFQEMADGMALTCTQIYEEIFHGISGLADAAAVTPSAFLGGTVWHSVLALSRDAIKPMALSLLTLFLLASLAQIFKKQDARGTDSIYFVAMVVLKIGIAKLCMDNIDGIVDLIFGASSALIGSIRLSTDVTLVSEIESYKQAIDGIDFIAAIIELGSIWLLSWVSRFCNLICLVIIYLRFIEIYVYAAVGPLAVATLPSEEYNSIFKNWIKRLSAQALHAVLIILCVYIYASCVTASNASLVGLGSFLSSTSSLGSVFKVILFQILLVTAVFQTGSWARSMVNAA